MSTYSPWKNTKIVNSGYLDVLKIRPVPASPDDKLYTVQLQYQYRPDLLAYDYYQSNQLWWVFAQRNLNVIRDPIYDFVSGIQIYLPDPNAIKRILG